MQKIKDLADLQKQRVLLSDDLEKAPTLLERMKIKKQDDGLERKIAAIQKELVSKRKTTSNKADKHQSKQDDTLRQRTCEGVYGVLLQLVANNDVYIEGKNNQSAVFVVDKDTKKLSAYDPYIDGNKQKEIIVSDVKRKMQQQKTPLYNQMLKDINALPKDNDISLEVVYNAVASRLYYSAQNCPEDAKKVMASLNKAAEILNNATAVYDKSVAKKAVEEITTRVQGDIEALTPSVNSRRA